MRLFIAGEGEVQLGPADFVASGGEGDVYAVGERAFKVYHDPQNTLPEGKLQALAVLSDPRLIRPEASLSDAQGRRVGYAMARVKDAEPLGRLANRSYRARVGLDAGTVLARVADLRALLLHIHACGLLAVDLSEQNCLVSADHQALWIIDVDSFATPHYPATAQLDTVRDRLAPPGVFSTGTDWFAFAVTSFQALIGLHPFRGAHPHLKSLDERMAAQVSVLSPEVKTPPTCFPLSGLPPRLLSWYQAVFERGERGEAPLWTQTPVVVAAPAALAALAGLQLARVARFDGPIRAVAWQAGVECVVTEASVYVNGHRTGAMGPGRVSVGFSARQSRPVVALETASGVSLWCAQTGAGLSGPPVKQVVAGEGQLFGLLGPNLVRLALCEVGDGLVVAPQVVARVVPGAATLFPGALIQALKHETLVTLLGRRCLTVRVEALRGLRVLDAKGEGGVLAVQGERAGRAWRCRLRLEGEAVEALPEEEGEDGAELAVLARGVSVTRHDGALWLHPAGRGLAGERRVDAQGLAPELQLVAQGDALLGFWGDSLWRLTLA